jgi:hypothetical protein
MPAAVRANNAACRLNEFRLGRMRSASCIVKSRPDVTTYAASALHCLQRIAMARQARNFPHSQHDSYSLIVSTLLKLGDNGCLWLTSTSKLTLRYMNEFTRSILLRKNCSPPRVFHNNPMSLIINTFKQ